MSQEIASAVTSIVAACCSVLLVDAWVADSSELFEAPDVSALSD